MLYGEMLRKISQLIDVPYNEMSPLRFGNDVAWQAEDTYILASQYISSNQALIIVRTECYTTNLTPAATDAMQYQVTPPGFAFWALTGTFNVAPVGNISDQTDQTNPAHLMLNVDNWLLFPANQYATLVGILDQTFDGAERRIRTTCYGALIPGTAYERLRDQFEWPNHNGA